ncbi:MAG: NlpC/P60 family protein [Lachnospiraceae bacterium]|nr:NlpC/P60 family protein [Lachnospiraceae bacterium]
MAKRTEGPKKRPGPRSKLEDEPSSAAHRRRMLKFQDEAGGMLPENTREAVYEPVKETVAALGKEAAAAFGKEAESGADENPGLEAAEESGKVAESAGSYYSRKLRDRQRTRKWKEKDKAAKLKEYEKAEKLKDSDKAGKRKDSDKAEKLKGGAGKSGSDVGNDKRKAAGRGAASWDAADIAGLEEAGLTTGGDAAEAASNPLSRWQQRRTLKREYARRRAGKTAEQTAATASSAGADVFWKSKGAAKESMGIAERIGNFAREHSALLLSILGLALLIVLLSGLLSSCSLIMPGGGNAVLGSSFTATDEDVTGAEEDYIALEEALREELDGIEAAHPGYDEYRYTLDEIGHNPYVLASYLTVVFEDYTREVVQETLQALFESQYTLTLQEEVEIRTRTVINLDTGEEEEEEYEYYILNVALSNLGLEEVIAELGLTDEETARYELLLETCGNRVYLFADDIYAASSEDYLDYDIPAEALTDTTFANLIREAEKYLGYPYVWGGSSPRTGFDCSGYVCWVLNHCGNGWDVGRTTAQGLLGYCEVVSEDEAQPGDLVFFEGTYGTGGVSHVGIYVGNGMMIHAGNPISYESIESSYWQSHFYCFGRLE